MLKTVGFTIIFLGIALLDQSFSNPIRGITTCLNNDDCLGSNRRCHRNSTLLTGICTCKEGFISANNDKIACLNLKIRECVDSSDCLLNYTCLHLPQYFNLRDSILQAVKSCIFTSNTEASSGFEGPRIGGGLRSSHIYDHFFGGRRNRIHPPFHPEYIKFVEDAMLVLFLLCVLVTLLIVHRASCFRNARRNGVLRFIIPHGDDTPPPYSQYGPPTTNDVVVSPDSNAIGPSNSQPVCASGVVQSDVLDGIQNRASFKESRPETPPPSYAEALLISQARSASLLDRVPQDSNLPLYIALPPPAPQTSTPH